MRKHQDKPTAKAEAKADKLLQKLVLKLNPKGEVCGEWAITGHHLVEKNTLKSLSQSRFLVKYNDLSKPSFDRST